jgi:hypothetical protein
MVQSKLGFDKREFAQRIDAIQSIPKVDCLTAGQLKCVKRFCTFVFSYNKSSAEGDLTLVASDETDETTNAILKRCQITVRALAYWIAWGKKSGLISSSTDCNGLRRRRTTISINWERIRDLLEVKIEPRQNATVAFSQNATVAVCEPRQNATVAAAKCNGCILPIIKHISESHTLTHSECTSEGGSDVEKIQGIKRELAELGVLGVNAVDQAIRAGVRIQELQRLVAFAQSQSPRPAPNVIFGRIKAMKETPSIAEAPYPHAIAVVRSERAADAAHEREKLRRRNLAVQIGAMPGDPGDERDRELEREFGPWLDAMGADERDEFARSVLSDFTFCRWRKDPLGPSVRLLLLEALEGRMIGQNG